VKYATATYGEFILRNRIYHISPKLYPPGTLHRGGATIWSCIRKPATGELHRELHWKAATAAAALKPNTHKRYNRNAGMEMSQILA
jgi:hypothetical protein